jgi:O-antigen/teichoic acid export membrane protein
VRLAHNSLLALGARGAGMLLSLLVVPLLIRGVGMELYGVLAITWAFLAQMLFLDLGFSAAATRYASRALARGRRRQAAEWTWAAISVQLLVGGAGAVVLWAASPSIVGLLRIGPEMEGAAVFAFRLFALVLPLELVTRSFTAVLEAAQRFRHVGALTLGASFGTNCAYLVGIGLGANFHALLLGVLAARLLLLALGFVLAKHVLPELAVLPSPFSRRLPLRARAMFGFGGWMTLNAAAGTLLQYMDRWLIAALLGVALVPLYVVPFTLAWHLNLIPFSVVATLFPAFAAMRETGDWARAHDYYLRTHRFLLTVAVPIIIVLFVWAPELLRLWIGEEFAAEAATPLRLLLAGMVPTVVIPVSAAVLQGAGRPDVLTRVYAVEIPLYAAGAVTFIGAWGITGAAAFFVIRAVGEALVLWIAIHRLFGWRWREGIGSLAPAAVAALIGVGAVGLIGWEPRLDAGVATACTLAALLLFGAYSRRLLLDSRDRAFLVSALRPRPG